MREQREQKPVAAQIAEPALYTYVLRAEYALCFADGTRLGWYVGSMWIQRTRQRLRCRVSA